MNKLASQKRLTEVLQQHRALKSGDSYVVLGGFAGRIHQKTERFVTDFASFLKEKLSTEEIQKQIAIAEKEGVLTEVLPELIFSVTEAFHATGQETTKLQSVFNNFALFNLTQSLCASTKELSKENFQAQMDNLDNQVLQELKRNRVILQDPVITNTVDLYVNRIFQESGYHVSPYTIATIEDQVKENKVQHQNTGHSSSDDVETLLRNGLSNAIMCDSVVEANALIDQFNLALTKTVPKQLVKKNLKP